MTDLAGIAVQIEDCLVSLNENILKFNKGNKAAGTRIRKELMEIKRLAQSGRVMVTEIKAKTKGE